MTQTIERRRTGRPIDPATVIADLGGGLVLRHATPEDAEVLAAFNGDIHRYAGATEPDAFVLEWTRKLLARPHPTLRPADFTVVEDTADGTIASSLCLIPQVWSYGGITFPAGRPELVGTHPDYRRRGLVRAQFDVVHRWAAERGMLMLGITGIPYYYRQFGYEMTLDLDAYRLHPLASIPDAPADEPEPFVVRQATERDLPAIAALDAQGRQRSLLSCVRGSREWRYELGRGQDPSSIGRILAVIERLGLDGEGRPGATGVSAAPRVVGYLVHDDEVQGTSLSVAAWELASGVPWSQAGPVALRYLRERARGYAEGRDRQPDRLMLMLGNEHPAYEGLPAVYDDGRPGYAWFTRVPDLAAFLWHVRRVLESRLRVSPISGYDGELKIGGYGRAPGVLLRFADGMMTAAEPWDGGWQEADASCPDLTLLHLVTGWRSFDEVRAIYPDFGTTRHIPRALLGALFPKQSSHVWPIS